MPWKEARVEEERVRFVAAWLDEDCDWTMSELCEAFGVSRKSGYKWVRRYQSLGLQGLRDQSRAPRTHANAVGAEVVEQLLRMRRRHRFWGPRKIVARLRAEQPAIVWPAASTVGDILKRHGLVRARRRRRGAAVVEGCGLSQPSGPKDQWSADFKGWFRTADRQRCDALTIQDVFSRFLLRCRVVERADEEHTRAVFRWTFRQYGLPLTLRIDNGPPFASSTALGGLTRLSVWWVKLGIGVERIAPGQPQQNGRHERLHRTLKQETACPPQANARAQQRAFDEFWYTYNFERPHEAVGGSPPAQWYEASPRPYAEREPEVHYPGDFEIRQVRSSGEIKWRGEFLYLSQALTGEPVGLQPISERHWRLFFAAVPLGLLDDHTRQLLAYRPRLRARSAKLRLSCGLPPFRTAKLESS